MEYAVRADNAAAKVTILAAPAVPVTDSMKRMHIPEFRERHGADGTGAVVGIIDTGIDGKHPFLAGAVAGGRSFVPGQGPDLWADDNGHGTHVAGVVAQAAPGARLWAAKALDRQGRGSWQAITDGVKWCLDTGCNILNLSLGGPGPYDPLGYAIEEAVKAQVLVVTAAGNEGPAPGTVGYPAAYPWPLAVAAKGWGRDGEFIPMFSSRGDQVDVTAPGVDALSTLPSGRWGTMSGTSQAAPHVAGAAALLGQRWHQVHKEWPLESHQVARLIFCTRRPKGAGAEWDPATGAGILDLGRVLELPGRRIEAIMVDGNYHLQVDGRAVEMPVSARVVYPGHFLVPARPLAEAFGLGIEPFKREDGKQAARFWREVS